MLLGQHAPQEHGVKVNDKLCFYVLTNKTEVPGPAASVVWLVIVKVVG